MKRQYIIAIDQGTTGSSVSIFEASTYELIATVKEEFSQYYPRSGWVEHCTDEIWASVVSAIRKAVRLARANDPQFSPHAIKALGSTNQRETVVALDTISGKALSRAIVWQDRRTAARCEQIKKQKALSRKITTRTGLVVDPYFSATKMEWMLRNIPSVQRAAREQRLVFATMDAFLLYRLTGNSVLATEDSNASRTMLYDLHTGEYSKELLSLFGLRASMLPPILPSASGFGVTQSVPGLPDGIPITGILGDQQAALFAHGGVQPGVGKITFGTGAFLLVHTGNLPVAPAPGMLQTVAYRIGSKRAFAIEASAFIAGAAIQFLRDNFHWLQKASDLDAFIATAPRDAELAFIPSLTGLGAPYWNPHARGALLGLTRGSSAAQIARAVAESIALQNVQLLKGMESSLGKKIKKLGVDGGVAKSDAVMQFQSDLLHIPLMRGVHTEMTALGAALIAATGLSGKLCKYTPHSTKTFRAQIGLGEAKKIVTHWERAAACIDTFYHR